MASLLAAAAAACLATENTGCPDKEQLFVKYIEATVDCSSIEGIGGKLRLK